MPPLRFRGRRRRSNRVVEVPGIAAHFGAIVPGRALTAPADGFVDEYDGAAAERRRPQTTDRP